ncbi:MAG: DUF1587 domain-containing protein [Bryobacteraceae bacterium]
MFARCLGLAWIACTAASAQQSASINQVILKQYCLGCHNDKVKTGDISVQGLNPANVSEDPGTWEKVLRKVSTGQMPPPGMPHPKPAALQSFAKWIADELDESATANPNPGRPTIHRLNRAEYSNAVRDLLALDIKPGAKLPADDIGYGFDNIGDVLSVSPVLVERYIAVARNVSRLALGDAKRKPVVDEFEMPRTGGRPTAPERASDDLPLNSAGGISIQYLFPADAEYVFKLKVPVGQGESKILEEGVSVKAGSKIVGVTFLGDNTVAEVVPVLDLGSLPRML